MPCKAMAHPQQVISTTLDLLTCDEKNAMQSISLKTVAAWNTNIHNRDE
jgi:hypothetical protein